MISQNLKVDNFQRFFFTLIFWKHNRTKVMMMKEPRILGTDPHSTRGTKPRLGYWWLYFVNKRCGEPRGSLVFYAKTPAGNRRVFVPEQCEKSDITSCPGMFSLQYLNIISNILSNFKKKFSVILVSTKSIPFSKFAYKLCECCLHFWAWLEEDWEKRV